jgi:1-acyl-sn-glycerol-3-phosphate acyltransferase
VTAPDAHPLAATPPSRSAAATGRNLAALATRAWKLHVTGADRVPHTGPVILASNHIGFLDGLLLVAAGPRPAHVLVSSDVWVAPFRRVLAATGQIELAGDVPDRRALLTARQVLDDGGAIGIFPESQRGAGAVAHVDHATAYLAARSGALVVPVAILGSRPAGRGADSLPRWRARIDVVFGPAFDVRSPGDPRRRAVLARSGERLRQVLSDHVRAACAETGQTLPGPLPTLDHAQRSDS